MSIDQAQSPVVPVASISAGEEVSDELFAVEDGLPSLDVAEEVLLALDVAEEVLLSLDVAAEAAAAEEAAVSDEAAVEEARELAAAAVSEADEDACAVSDVPAPMSATIPNAISPPVTRQASAGTPTRSQRRRRGLTGVFTSSEVMQ